MVDNSVVTFVAIPVSDYLRSASPEAIYLLITLCCYLVGLLVGRLLKRRLKVDLNWTYQVAIVALSIYAGGHFTGLRLPITKEIGLVGLISFAWPLNALLYRFVWPHYGYPGEQARIPSFLPQVVGILLVVVVSFIALGIFYHVTVPGVLAGSGIIAIILGLALQETLGNLFAGLGLHTERAFRVGDWLILDGMHVEVIEINWRSTRLRTNDGVSYDIPNSQLARATIINLYYPTAVHAMRAAVGVEYRVPPNQVKDALVRAARNAPGVLEHPAPVAYLMRFGDSTVDYEIKFWLDDGKRFPVIIDAVRTNIWYEFGRLQIPFGFPVLELTRPQTRSGRAPNLAELFRQQPLFDSLENSQIERLMRSHKLARFGRGERIIEQGAPGHSMYILSRGTAKVVLKHNQQESVIKMLEEGDCFGEMSLLTGATRAATIVAETDCEVIEIGKSALRELLLQNPRLAENLSETVTNRRVELEAGMIPADQGTDAKTRPDNKEGFLFRLRQFFEL